MLNRTRLRMEEYELQMRESDDLSPKLMQSMTKLTVATKRADSLTLQLDEQAAQHRTELSSLKHELTSMAHQLEDALSGPMSPPRLKESYESKISSYEQRIAEMRSSYEIRISTAERRSDESREHHADLEAELAKAQSELKWYQESNQERLNVMQDEKLRAIEELENALLERDEMERQVAQIQHKLEDALHEIELLRTQISEANHALQLERQKSQSLESECSRLEITISQTELHADDLRAGEEAAARIYNQAMETMNAERESHSIEVRELKTLLHELRRHEEALSDQLTQQARESQQERSTLQHHLSESRMEIDTMHSQRSMMEKELSSSRSDGHHELEALHHEFEDTKMSMRGLEKLLAEAAKERGMLDEKIEELERELLHSRDSSKHGHREMATLQDRCDYLEEMLKDLRVDRDSQASVVNDQFDELRMKQEEGSTLKSELGHLQESYKLIAASEAECRDKCAALEREGPRGKHQLVQAEHTLALMKDELEHTRKMARKAGEELTASSVRHSDDMDMAMNELSTARSKQTEMAHQLRSGETELMQLRDQLHRAELVNQRAVHTAEMSSQRRPSEAHVARRRPSQDIKFAMKPVAPKVVESASAYSKSHLDLSDHDRLVQEAANFHLDMGI